MPENTPTCQIHKKYERIKCQNAARPGDADGFCILHSQDKEKNQDDFKAALQDRWQQADQGKYDFRRVFFPGPFDPQNFFGCREFAKPADFSRATFTERVNFFWATFTKEAEFSGATFTEEAYFFGAAFTKGAGFSSATFAKEADFSIATFKDEAVFSEAKFFGRVVFQGLNPQWDGKLPPPPFGAFLGGWN
jgi:hypothetical protein